MSKYLQIYVLCDQLWDQIKLSKTVSKLGYSSISDLHGMHGLSGSNPLGYIINKFK